MAFVTRHEYGANRHCMRSNHFIEVANLRSSLTQLRPQTAMRCGSSCIPGEGGRHRQEGLPSADESRGFGTQ